MSAKLPKTEIKRRTDTLLEQRANGHTVAAIARELGIGVTTLHHFIRDYIETDENVYQQWKHINSTPAQILDEAGIEGSWGHAWLKQPHASVFVRNHFEVKGIENTIRDIVKDAKPPKYRKIKRVKTKEGHCLVVSFADHHLNKLGDEDEVGSPYSTDVAVKRWNEGLAKVMSYTDKYPIDKIIFIIGNDILNADTPKGTTTKGTPQDTDVMWHRAFRIAVGLYEKTILSLVDVADVEVYHCPSNHDFVLGSALAFVIEQRFKEHPNVLCKIDMAHRNYTSYGNTCIGFDHGDGAKDETLARIIPLESMNQGVSGQDTKHYVFFRHHIHHKIAKDYSGIEIRYLRSCSGDDRWHYTQGYIAKPAIEAFLFHREMGKIGEFTHFFAV